MSDSTQSLNGTLIRLLRTVCLSFKAAALAVMSTMTQLLTVIEEWLLGAKRAQYGLAVARILLGVMIVGMVLSNLPTLWYTFGSGAAWTGQLEFPTSSFATIYPFSFVNQAAHSDVGLLLVAIALIVSGVLFTIGYRTKLVMVPLFVLWVGFLSINTYVQDQSDNLTRIALIALFFTALSDRWSVDARRRRINKDRPGSVLGRLWRFQQVAPSWFTNLLHNLAVVTIICQLCFVYASGGLFKAGGIPWQDGTAIYDPLMTQRFGTWPILSELVTTWGPGVAIATLGTVLVQATFPFLMVHRFTRIFGLLVIMSFHLGIAVLMGLPWFSLSMVALDAVFVRDVTWKKLEQRVGASWRQLERGKSQESALEKTNAIPEETGTTSPSSSPLDLGARGVRQPEPA